MATAGRGGGGFWTWILYDGGPAVGPGGWGSTQVDNLLPANLPLRQPQLAGQIANVSAPCRMVTPAEIDAEINVPVEKGGKFTTPDEGIGIVMCSIGYFSWSDQ